MKRFAWLLVLVACAAPPREPSLTLGRIFTRPDDLPRGFAFNHDATRLAYLKARPDGGLTDLWVYDIGAGTHEVLLEASGPETLTKEQRAARERRRERSFGISRYWWNPKDDTILVASSGDLHLLQEGALTQLTQTEAPERNPRWSPDGASIAYVRDKNLYVRKGHREWRLTSEGGGAVSCGLAEFIAMEELGRHDGFWWSKDSRSIAYVEVDESPVPRFFMHDYLDARGKPVGDRYPRAGDPNVAWTLKVVPAAGGKPVAMRVEDEYLVRVDWMPDGALAVQVADRAQRRLRLMRCDPATGEATLLLEETDGAWVAFHRDLRFLDDGRFLWSSERSGRRHLYVWELGALRPITSGDWDVAGVVGVSEAGRVYFTGGREAPNDRQLYAVRVDGTGFQRLTKEPGWHSATANGDATRFVVTASRAGGPTRVTLRGRDEAVLGESRPPPGMVPPEFVTIPAEDGTPLRGMLMRPMGGGAGPAIVYCYGGPGAHLVADRWGGRNYLWHTRMVQKGYTILTVDNRGAGGYGRDFCRIVSGRLCDWEVRDQTAAARWLGRQPYVDASRIGIWGWSYGGTLTLMCLLASPEVFRAGVAVAPVTDWRDYDTAYTERYLGLPKENGEGYDFSSPITAAADLGPDLFLAHGFMDDNVHFRGSVAFLDRVQRGGTWIETDFYPRGAHGIGGRGERALLFKRMERFWETHLGR